MKILVIGDSHIDDPYLDELNSIFEEIISHDADELIHLGDFYNFRSPSPKSLLFGTEWAVKFLKKYKKVTILAGNGRHDWQDNVSAVEYLKLLGINVVGAEHERTIDKKKCLFGHHMAYESKLAYGTSFYSEDSLKKYDIVLLGHQHLPEDKSLFHHVGSCFFQHMNEADPIKEQKGKRIACIEKGELSWIPLKSTIPMVNTSHIDDLDSLDKNTKVQLYITNYTQFKNFVNILPKYKKHFLDFKYELKFDKQEKVKENKKDTSLLLTIEQEIENIKDPEVKDLLKKVFIKA